MIYTFSFDTYFLNQFKNDLKVNEATLIYQFINNNFIQRQNFYLKTNEKRKKFFSINTNGGNGPLLKTLLSKLSKKYKNFPKKLKKTDFIFSNLKDQKANIKLFSHKDILNNHINIEEDLEENYKPFWQQSNKLSEQANKRSLARNLERVVDHSDEVFLVDRHVPRAMCKCKSNIKKSGDDRRAKAYLNSLEYFSSILKNKESKNRFFCGLLNTELNGFNNEGLNIESILKEAFLTFKDIGLFVHLFTKYEAYEKLHERLIIGLIKDPLNL